MCYLLCMKIFFTFIFLIFSPNIYGEIIYCTYEYDSKGEEFLLERSGDKFNWTTADNNKFTFDILWEDINDLILGENFTYNEVPRYLTMWIEKETSKLRGMVLDKPSNEPTLRVEEGNCRFF